MLTQSPSDVSLLKEIQGGNHSAFSILVNRHTTRCYNMAFRYLHNQQDAEDIVQQAFLKLWKIAPSWKQDKAQVSTWLYRVVSNLCKDRYRRATLEGMVSVQEPTNESQSPSSKIEEEIRQKALYTAMSLLPQSQRLAVQLRHIDELTNPQIAEIMELSVEAVESLTARGKRKLTKILQSHKSELGYSHG